MTVARPAQRLLSVGISLLALTLSAGNPALSEDRALIIGVDRYPNLPESMQLTASANDARLMTRLATEVWGFDPRQIRLLVDEDATSTSIMASLEDWIVSGTRPGDRVLISFSGHGHYVADIDGDEADGWDEVIAPSDVRLEANGFTKTILDDQIGAFVDRLTGRNVVIVVDSCHSGTITRALDPHRRAGESIVRSLGFGRRTRGLSGQMFEGVRRDKAFIDAHEDMLVWTAVSASQLAQEDVSAPVGSRNGVFTGAFAEGLIDQRADANQNGRISAAELLAYVRTRTLQYCETYPCETGMTPTLEAPANALAVNLLAWEKRGEPLVVAANSGGDTSAGADQVTNPDIDVDSSHEAAATGDTAPVAHDEQHVEVSQEGDQNNTPELGDHAHDDADEVSHQQPGSSVAADDILPQDNTFGVRVEILPGPDVALGDDIKVRVTSPEPGYLILLDLRDNGAVYQLFPSICAPPERLLRADAPLILPDGSYGCVFKATEAGSGRILAIVSEDNVALEDLLAEHRDLQVVPETSAYLASLVHRLLSVWTGDERNRAVRWALASADYSIGR